MNQIISILNSFKEIITFENITFLLGLIGSAGTAWQVIQSRRKIHLSLPYFGYSADRQLALAYIQFDNLSNSAISITDISIVINGITYPCDKLPTTVASLTGKSAEKPFHQTVCIICLFRFAYLVMVGVVVILFFRFHQNLLHLIPRASCF